MLHDQSQSALQSCGQLLCFKKFSLILRKGNQVRFTICILYYAVLKLKHTLVSLRIENGHQTKILSRTHQFIQVIRKQLAVIRINEINERTAKYFLPL